MFCVEANKKLDGMRLENRLAGAARNRREDRRRREDERRWRESQRRNVRETEEFMDFLRESLRQRQDRTNAEEDEEKSSSVGVFFCVFFGIW